jgi:hypothetical protein
MSADDVNKPISPPALAWLEWVEDADPGSTYRSRRDEYGDKDIANEVSHAFIAGYNVGHAAALEPLVKAFEPPGDPEDKPD